MIHFLHCKLLLPLPLPGIDGNKIVSLKSSTCGCTTPPCLCCRKTVEGSARKNQIHGRKIAFPTHHTYRNQGPLEVGVERGLTKADDNLFPLIFLVRVGVSQCRCYWRGLAVPSGSRGLGWLVEQQLLGFCC